MFRENKKFIEYLTLSSLAVLITVFLIFSGRDIFGFFMNVIGMLKPFFIGFAFAYILNPMVKFLESKFSLKRSISIAIVYLGIIVGLSIFVNLVIPNIMESSVQVAKELPTQLSSWEQKLEDNTMNIGPVRSYVMDNIEAIGKQLMNWANILFSNLTGILFGMTSAVMTTVFATIVSIYALIDQQKFVVLSKKLMVAVMDDEKVNKSLNFFGKVNEIFSRFITGLIVEALIVGVVAFIGFTIMKVKYSLILAIIICFTNVIPYIGPFIGAAPAVIITMLYSPAKALGVAIFILILQQVDGNIIGPKIMGNYIGLAPIWIILAITLGGGFGGMLGMVLSVPLAAIVKIILERVLEKRLQDRTTSIDIEE